MNVLEDTDGCFVARARALSLSLSNTRSILMVYGVLLHTYFQMKANYLSWSASFATAAAGSLSVL